MQLRLQAPAHDHHVLPIKNVLNKGKTFVWHFLHSQQKTMLELPWHMCPLFTMLLLPCYLYMSGLQSALCCGTWRGSSSGKGNRWWWSPVATAAKGQGCLCWHPVERHFLNCQEMPSKLACTCPTQKTPKIPQGKRETPTKTCQTFSLLSQLLRGRSLHFRCN